MIVRGFGKTLTVAGIAPMPLRATGEPVTVVLAVIANVPFTVPMAVGLKTTLMVQVAVATVRVPVQVPPAAPAGREKLDGENTRVMPVTSPVPVLFNTSCMDALVAPGATLLKLSGPPLTLATGVFGGRTYSTAPMSTALLVFLVLPKKSNAGASPKFVGAVFFDMALIASVELEVSS